MRVEDHGRRDDGGRDGREGNYRYAPGAEEQPEEPDRDQQADQQRKAKTAHGVLNGGRGAEHGGVQLDSGQAGFHIFQRRLNILGDLHRAGSGELLNDQHQAGVLSDDGVADQGLMVFPDLGNIAQRASPASNPPR